MAHEQLDPAHVGTGFQQMRGERVTQRVRCYWLLDPAALTCKLACLADGITADGVSGNVAWKQPLARVGVVPVGSQDLEQPRREHHVPVLAILALAHTDDHALAVNVGDRQVDDFRHPQAGCVRNHQNGPVLQAGNGVEEGGDLSRLRTTGSLNGFFGSGKSSSLQSRLSVTR